MAGTSPAMTEEERSRRRFHDPGVDEAIKRRMARPDARRSFEA
jgi:hypothetical protein